MRIVLIAVLALGLLAACTPQPPTGNAIAQVTGLNDATVLFTVEKFPQRMGNTPVRVVVSGDIVRDEVIVNGESLSLVGVPASGEWLSGSGTAILYLGEGTHKLRAYSCSETLTGWECGCRKKGDCGYWMERTITIE